MKAFAQLESFIHHLRDLECPSPHLLSVESSGLQRSSLLGPQKHRAPSSRPYPSPALSCRQSPPPPLPPRSYRASTHPATTAQAAPRARGILQQRAQCLGQVVAAPAPAVQELLPELFGRCPHLTCCSGSGCAQPPAQSDHPTNLQANVQEEYRTHPK